MKSKSAEQRVRRQARRLDLQLRKLRGGGGYYLLDMWQNMVVAPYNFDGHSGLDLVGVAVHLSERTR